MADLDEKSSARAPGGHTTTDGGSVSVHSPETKTAQDLESVETEDLELTPAEERRLRRIVDWRILPYLSLLYLLSEHTSR